MEVSIMRNCLLFLTIAVHFTLADEHNHKYTDGDEVVAWVNTVGPYHNQQETYRYFSLPFCRGPKQNISHHHETFGEHLLGVELEFSGLEIFFKQNVPSKQYCSLMLDSLGAQKLVYAAANNYWFEMLIDDLPAHGQVGTIKSSSSYVFTHKSIGLSYNGNRIIAFNLNVSNPMKIHAGAQLTFSYDVQWHQTNVPFEKRFNAYLDSRFFTHNVHWFSIFNSFMMVVFLVAFVSMILNRTLHHDFTRYGLVPDNANNIADANDYSFERDLIEEYGWKQVHSDVFRAPRHVTILASLLGTGAHLAVCFLLLIVMAMIGRLYTERASMIGACIFLYSALSPINGFVSGSLYSQWNGKKWIKTAILTYYALKLFYFFKLPYIHIVHFIEMTSTIHIH